MLTNAVDDGWGSDLEIDDDDDIVQDDDDDHVNHNGSDIDYHAVTPTTTNRKIATVDRNDVAATHVDVIVTNDGFGPFC